MFGDFSGYGVSLNISSDVRVLRTDNLKRQLFDAVESGDGTLLSRLMETNEVPGAELDEYENTEGDSLLSCAVRRGDADMTERLIKAGSNVNRLDRQGSTVLHLAVYRGPLHVVRLLLAHGANASVQVERGRFMGLNALHLAAVEGHEEVVTELLKCGNDSLVTIEGGTYEGWDALHLCAARGRVAVIDALIRAGVSIEATVRTGESQGLRALHIAALNGRADVAASLIKAGCDITAVVQTGHYLGGNALHLAVVKKRASMVSILIEAGAKVSTPVEAGPEKGQDALYIAICTGQSDIIARLWTAGVDCSPHLRSTITSRDWGFAKLLVERLPFEALPSLDLTPVFTEPPVSGGFAISRYKIRQQRLAQMLGVRYLTGIADNAGSESDPQHKELYIKRLSGSLLSISNPDRARVLASIVFASTMEEGTPPHAHALYLLFLLNDLEAPQRDGMRKAILEKIRMLDLGYVQVNSDGTKDGFVKILTGQDKTGWVPWLTRQLLRQLRYSSAEQDFK